MAWMRKASTLSTKLTRVQSVNLIAPLTTIGNGHFLVNGSNNHSVNGGQWSKIDSYQRRNLSTSGGALNSDSGSGWFSKLGGQLVRKIEPGKDSHSRLLTDSEAIYELQLHDVKPDSMESYLKSYEQLVNELKSKDETYELVGSWKVDVGDQDQVVNLWRYQKGYRLASKTHEIIRSDANLINIFKDQAKQVRKRNNQFLMAFSFWGHPQPEDRQSNYEMRSYVLKPGTMIEWGNNWARGINFRTNQVGGFFGQIGQLYTVHHIWHYKDLAMRKEVREDSWSRPGWDEVVAYTVPLIREMRSRWMTPNKFSPIK